MRLKRYEILNLMMIIFSMKPLMSMNHLFLTTCLRIELIMKLMRLSNGFVNFYGPTEKSFVANGCLYYSTYALQSCHCCCLLAIKKCK